MPQVKVVIVNFKSGPMVIQCLKSLERELSPLSGSGAIVVDNASKDGSAEQIREAISRSGWGGWAKLIEHDRNDGFGAGNNVGIQEAFSQKGQAPDYILLLNPDAYIHEGAIHKMLDFADARKGVGIIGPRLEFQDGVVQRSAFHFPSILGEVESGMRLGLVSTLLSRWAVAPKPRSEAHRTDWVSGACMLIRRQVLEEVGLFDEEFFLYYEEIDLCKRAHANGWECWYFPESRVVHHQGGSTGVSDRAIPPRRPTHWFDSRRHYLVKHHGAFYCFVADLVWMLAYSTWKIRAAIQRKPDRDSRSLLPDFFRNSILFKGSSKQ